MKRTLRPYHLLTSFILITLSTSAQTLNPLFRHLPPDAGKIYHINLPALISKLSLEEIVSSIPPSKAAADQQLIELLKDPAQTGIDIHQDIFVAQSGTEHAYDSSSYYTVLVHLSDSGKFVALLRSKEKGFRTFLPLKGRVLGKERMALAYNDKLAVFTVITPSGKDVIKATQRKSSNGKPLPPISSTPYTLAAAKKSLAALQGFTTSFYTTDPVFTAGFSDDADFHMWGLTGEGLSKFSDMVKAKTGKKLNMGSAKGNQMHTLTVVRFDAGKIVMRTATVIPPDSAKNYSLFNSRPLNMELISRLPGKAMLGMINIHFDPAMLMEFLERNHFRSMLDSALASKGLTTSDMLKAFKGDFLVAGMRSATDTIVDPSIYFVTTIGDPMAFMKLAGKLMNTDSSSTLFGKLKVAYTLKDNILVVGRNKQQTDAYFSSTPAAGNTDMVTDRIRTNTFSVAIDAKAIAGLLKASAPPEGSSAKTQQMLHFIDALDRLTVTAGGIQNGVLESYFELKMADASENSLRSIFKLMH
jgi:hypothetical protein